ncbi:MAG: hypothetical protein ABI620_03195 [Chloroflexota bacterium]
MSSATPAVASAVDSAAALERPPITVTVATIQGWPEIRDAIMSVAVSTRQAGGELVVTDGSGLPAPSPEETGSGVRWLSFPGESTFQLRARAYSVAQGELVAITEDHVSVPLDWAERHVAAHRAHPEAQAIGGSVENAATGNVMDWASFLVVQAAVMAPIKSGPARRLSGAVNVSYTRSALADLDDFEGMGAMDGLHQGKLAAGGGALRNDDSIRGRHDQSLGCGGTTASHYHAGRTMSGFRRQHMTVVDGLRIVGALVVPLARYARLVVLHQRRGSGGLVARCTPAILWLLYSQGLGQFVGYVRGPGDSPRKVQ